MTTTRTALKNALLLWEKGAEQSHRLAFQVLLLSGFDDIVSHNPQGGRDGGMDLTCKKDKDYGVAVTFPYGKVTDTAIVKKAVSDYRKKPVSIPGFIFFTNQKITKGLKKTIRDRCGPIEIIDQDVLLDRLNMDLAWGIRKAFFDIPIESESLLAINSQMIKLYALTTRLMDRLEQMEHSTAVRQSETTTSSDSGRIGTDLDVEFMTTTNFKFENRETSSHAEIGIPWASSKQLTQWLEQFIPKRHRETLVALETFVAYQNSQDKRSNLHLDKEKVVDVINMYYALLGKSISPHHIGYVSRFKMASLMQLAMCLVPCLRREGVDNPMEHRMLNIDASYHVVFGLLLQMGEPQPSAAHLVNPSDEIMGLMTEHKKSLLTLDLRHPPIFMNALYWRALMMLFKV